MRDTAAFKFKTGHDERTLIAIARDGASIKTNP